MCLLVCVQVRCVFKNIVYQLIYNTLRLSTTHGKKKHQQVACTCTHYLFTSSVNFTAKGQCMYNSRICTISAGYRSSSGQWFFKFSFFFMYTCTVCLFPYQFSMQHTIVCCHFKTIFDSLNGFIYHSFMIYESFHFSLCIHVQFVCFLTNSPCNTLLSAAILKPFLTHWMVSYIIHSLISKKPMIMPKSNTHEHIPKWFLQSAVHLFVPVLGQDGLWPEQNTTYQ